MKIKSNNKSYVYIGFDDAVAETFKKSKPKKMTMSKFLQYLLLLIPKK